MSELTEKTDIDLININASGAIQVRRATVILRDGEPLPDLKRYHRSSYEPGMDIGGEASIVKAIAGLVWTPDVLKAAAERREAAAAALAALATPPEEPTTEQGSTAQ